MDAHLSTCMSPARFCPAASQHLALLCLGEIGRRTDLSGVAGVDAAINTALSSESEDVKAAASLALGGVACGNLGLYLPTLLKSIQVCVWEVWTVFLAALHCSSSVSVSHPTQAL